MDPAVTSNPGTPQDLLAFRLSCRQEDHLETIG